MKFIIDDLLVEKLDLVIFEGKVVVYYNVYIDMDVIEVVGLVLL